MAMKITSSTASAVFDAKSERLKLQGLSSVELEKKRLKEATKQFEAFFNYYMLKTMRETIPKSGLEEDLPLNGGDGQEAFTDMFDMELSKAGTGGARSISDILYRSLEKTVEAKYSSEKTASESSAGALPKFVPLQSRKVQIKSLQSQPIELKLDSKQGIPIIPKQELSPHQPKIGSSVKEKYSDHIEAAARETDLDSNLIASVIQAESGGDPNAVSKAGAKGLMQLADTTAQDYGVTNVFDPGENIRAGSRFLKSLVNRYQDLKLALAAYNAGPGNVDKFGGIPPFKETQDYVARVTNSVNHTDMRTASAKGSSAKSDN